MAEADSQRALGKSVIINKVLYSIIFTEKQLQQKLFGAYAILDTNIYVRCCIVEDKDVMESN